MKYKNILHIGSHLTNGSPDKFGRQLQMGLWFTTRHCAPNPHVPMQGLIHCRLLQALSLSQSELTIHSGLHDGGLPLYPAIQEQTACAFIVRQ